MFGIFYRLTGLLGDALHGERAVEGICDRNDNEDAGLQTAGDVIKENAEDEQEHPLVFAGNKIIEKNGNAYERYKIKRKYRHDTTCKSSSFS